MAFPVILLSILMICRPVAEWTGKTERRQLMFVAGVSVAALINLFWYDVICMFIKPENMLAMMAPVAKSFNNTVLVFFMLGILSLCIAVAWIDKKWVYVGFVICSICAQQMGYPDSLSHTIRFKQLGQVSGVFRFLEAQKIHGSDGVAIHSADESSFFLACVNDYMLPQVDRMFYAESIDEDLEADWLIICAKDAIDSYNNTQGRRYYVSWSFMNRIKVPDDRYEIVFKDEFYYIYRKCF